jgi:hypothetical protein
MPTVLKELKIITELLKQYSYSLINKYENCSEKSDIVKKLGDISMVLEKYDCDTLYKKVTNLYNVLKQKQQGKKSKEDIKIGIKYIEQLYDTIKIMYGEIGFECEHLENALKIFVKNIDEDQLKEHGIPAAPNEIAQAAPNEAAPKEDAQVAQVGGLHYAKYIKYKNKYKNLRIK